MYLAGGTLLVVLVAEVYRAVEGRTKIEDRGLYRLAAYLSVTILLCLTWSFPMLQGGERAMGAFGQHYALRWVSDHSSPLDPWIDYESIVGKMFPGAVTPAQAFLSNPTEWLRFTVNNMFGIITAIGSLLVSPQNILIESGLIIGLMGILSVAAWSMYKRTQSIGLSSARNTVPLVESALYAVAPLAALVLVYPDTHYAVILVAALMPCCVAVGRWQSWSKTSDLFVALLAALTIAVGAWPLPVTDQPTLKAIIALRNLNLPINRMLEIDGGWCTYLKPRCTPEYPWSNSKHASETIVDRKVDAIMISKRLIDLLQTRHDVSLDALSIGGAEWHRYEIGDGLYLLHREIHP